MSYSDYIADLFDYISFYIDKFVKYFEDNTMKNLLIYLFSCFPEDVRFILAFMFFLLILAGFILVLKR